MAWTDYFIKSIPGAKVVASADAKPYVSHEIALREYVEIELNIQNEALPFHIFFRRFDAIGGMIEKRVAGHQPSIHFGISFLSIKFLDEGGASLFQSFTIVTLSFR